MAWAMKCDRCGKFFDYNLDDCCAMAYLIYDVLKTKHSIDGEKYDLCPDCIESLGRWFNRKDD